MNTQLREFRQRFHEKINFNVKSQTGIIKSRKKKNEIPCRKEKKIDKSWLQLAITPD